MAFSSLYELLWLSYAFLLDEEAIRRVYRWVLIAVGLMPSLLGTPPQSLFDIPGWRKGRAHHP
jgi:hypothetical protein